MHSTPAKSAQHPNGLEIKILADGSIYLPTERGWFFWKRIVPTPPDPLDAMINPERKV